MKQQPLGTLLIVSFLLLAQLSTAQTKVVKGYIKDALSDERIPFASIQFIKSAGGRLSDSAGNFIFRLADWPGDTLLVSYVGYKDYKVFIGGDFLKRAVGNELELIIGLERGKLTSEAVVRKKIDRGLLMW
ncbi:MAG: carboxypeptidase-like regulatory domain-containing protein, partial [Flavihumibacter sp.]|nr:carboxypeptidase-like regulatory domain-containing protein [Flavihumibacter sp.]